MCEVFEILDRELSRLEIEPNLRDRIGETLRNGLIRELGGGYVYVDKIDRESRDRQARVMRSNGATIERIALALDCSPKTVRKAIRDGE